MERNGKSGNQNDKKENSETKVNTTVQEVINSPADVHSQEVITELSKLSKHIKLELGKVESAFTKIAFNFHWTYENNAYKALRYKNIYDFTKVEFNIARGTCSSFISVVDQFAKRVDSHIVEEIDEKFKHFKSSQLTLMLNLSNEDIQKLDCELSVQNMKNTIRTITNASEDIVLIVKLYPVMIRLLMLLVG